MELPTYEVAFLERAKCPTGLGTFRFERPDGYTFVPGQFLSLTLQTRDGQQTEHFTHSESPLDPYLEITTRLTGSAFKDALVALTAGVLVTVAGPRGRLMLSADQRKVTFLVGGVGITPARSIIRDSVQRGTGLEVVLFYGNQVEACIPFREELDTYAATVEGIRVVHVLAEPGPGWKGERGFITADVVRRHISPHEGWHWVVTGPPAMIVAMQRVLTDLEVPSSEVSVEAFSGYD